MSAFNAFLLVSSLFSNLLTLLPSDWCFRRSSLNTISLKVMHMNAITYVWSWYGRTWRYLVMSLRLFLISFNEILMKRWILKLKHKLQDGRRSKKKVTSASWDPVGHTCVWRRLSSCIKSIPELGAAGMIIALHFLSSIESTATVTNKLDNQ